MRDFRGQDTYRSGSIQLKMCNHNGSISIFVNIWIISSVAADTRDTSYVYDEHENIYDYGRQSYISNCGDMHLN